MGIPIAYIMPMTAVPQRTAMSHACGALAAALVGTAEFYRDPHQPKYVLVALMIETLLGFLTFTGSLMAMGKLQEVLPQRPITYRGQNVINLALFAAAAGIAVRLVVVPSDAWLFPVFVGPGAAVRRAADHSHRRRGYAHGDRALELLRGTLGLRHGVRAR